MSKSRTPQILYNNIYPMRIPNSDSEDTDEEDVRDSGGSFIVTTEEDSSIYETESDVEDGSDDDSDDDVVPVETRSSPYHYDKCVKARCEPKVKIFNSSVKGDDEVNKPGPSRGHPSKVKTKCRMRNPFWISSSTENSDSDDMEVRTEILDVGGNEVVCENRYVDGGHLAKGISFKNNSLYRNINPKNLSKELIEDLKIVDKYLSDEDDDIGLALGNNNNTAYADETRKTNVRTHNYSDTEEDGGSRFSIDMTLCDPWELKIVQKCWVRVKTFHLQDHVRKLQENSVKIVNLSSILKWTLKIPKEAATIVDLCGRGNVIEETVVESSGGEKGHFRLPACQRNCV